VDTEAGWFNMDGSGRQLHHGERSPSGPVQHKQGSMCKGSLAWPGLVSPMEESTGKCMLKPETSSALHSCMYSCQLINPGESESGKYDFFAKMLFVVYITGKWERGRGYLYLPQKEFKLVCQFTRQLWVLVHSLLPIALPSISSEISMIYVHNTMQSLM
jgi:hypothetical protein